MIRRIDQDQGATRTISGLEKEPQSPQVATAPFHPQLGSYFGPLDLLLYLIHQDEIDIFDIPITLILDQYLEHVEALQSQGRLDLEEAGAFLVMASRLMEIKSRLLLPATSTEGDEELLEEEVVDPRTSLVEQLSGFLKQQNSMLI